MADAVSLNPGSIVATDRGYNGYGLFGKWTAEETYSVTRLKENAAYEVVAECAVPKDSNIRSDQLIRFTGAPAQKDSRSRTVRCAAGRSWASGKGLSDLG
jgi:hypothetical protein